MLATKQVFGEVWSKRWFYKRGLILVNGLTILLSYRRLRILLLGQDKTMFGTKVMGDPPNTGTLRAHSAPFILSSSVPGSRAL